MAKKQGLTIGKTRTALYKTARFLGDVNAIQRGTILARIGTRIIGPLVSRLFGGFIRAIFGKR